MLRQVLFLPLAVCFSAGCSLYRTWNNLIPKNQRRAKKCTLLLLEGMPQLPKDFFFLFYMLHSLLARTLMGLLDPDGTSMNTKSLKWSSWGIFKIQTVATISLVLKNFKEIKLRIFINSVGDISLSGSLWINETKNNSIIFLFCFVFVVIWNI